jgi:hypothetical protein
MQDAWAKLPPDYLIWTATRPGVLADRELRLFAVWAARQVQHLMTDQRSLDALDVAERHANGEATDAELNAAREAARIAARDAAMSSAGVAAWATAWAVARAAAGAADAAMDAAMDAAEAAGAAQAQWLRENTKPNFSKR